MHRKQYEKSGKGFPILLFALVAMAVVGAGLYFGLPALYEKAGKGKSADAENSPATGEASGVVRRPVPMQTQNVVDVDDLDQDRDLRDMMRDRKEKYGVEDSVDAILKSGESLKVGGSTVTMREILEKIRIKRGDLVEDVISGGGAGASEKSLPSDRDVFGIYVVKSNDNIWNIHFSFLRDYFENKGIRIASGADEPDDAGFSSGVGKLLKFSEKIVYIYNMRDRKLDADLDVISPSTKIVVFHMGEIFAFLDELDLKNVDRIQFDGENIWIPADQG